MGLFLRGFGGARLWVVSLLSYGVWGCPPLGGWLPSLLRSWRCPLFGWMALLSSVGAVREFLGTDRVITVQLGAFYHELFYVVSLHEIT